MKRCFISYLNLQKARNFSGLLTLVLFVGAFVCVSPVLAQSAFETQNRIKRLENEVQTLSRAVYRGEKPPAGASVGGGADVEIRLQQIERELRELRGTFEQQAHEMRQLRAELERVGSDLELRINDLEGGRSADNRGAGGNPSAPYTVRPSVSVVPSQPVGDSYQWRSGRQDTPAADKNGTLGSYVQKPGGNGSDSARSSGDKAAALYESAFSLIKNAKYAAAEKQFSMFLEAYPDHVLAGNAKYWLGETYYVRGNFEVAARVFAEGYQKYPKGAKAADNLLKLGMSLAGLGKTADACIALGQLNKENLAGSGPVMRRAAQEKKRLGCS